MDSSNSEPLIFAIVAVIIVVVVIVIIIETTSGTTGSGETVPGVCGGDGSPLLLDGKLTSCSISGNYQRFSPGFFAATPVGPYGDYQTNSVSNVAGCQLFSEQNGCVAWAFNPNSHDAPCRAWLDTPYAVTPDMNGWISAVKIGAPASTDSDAGRQGSGACSSQAAPYNLSTADITCEDDGQYLKYTGYPTGTGKYMGDAQSSATSVKECRKFCEANKGCTAFAISTDLTGTYPCRIFKETIPAITSDFTNWETYIYDKSIIE